MSKRFGHVQQGSLQEIITSPNGWDGTVFGVNATNDTYRKHNLWPVEVGDPGAGQWEQESNRTHTVDTEREVVVETVHYELVPLDERKTEMSDQAQREYDASLGRGFSYDGATWPANGRKRTRVHEIATQIANGKALPNGKTSMTFVDASGTAHSLDSTQIVELGAAGQDLIDAADDRLAQLEADIAAATSHSDLDAIDVESGWPD